MFLLLAPVLIYSAERPVTFSDARVSAMGNTFTAIADDKNMLFFNPAGFATYGLIKTSLMDAIINPTLWKPRYTNIGDLTVGSVTMGMGAENQSITSRFNTIFNSIADGDAFTSDFEIALKRVLFKFYPSFKDLAEAFDIWQDYEDGNISSTNAAISLQQLNLTSDMVTIHVLANAEIMSYARHNFGLGVFASYNMIIKVSPPKIVGTNISDPGIKAHVYSDIIYPIGVGFRIPAYKKWSVGATFKYFHRLKIEINNADEYTKFNDFMDTKPLDSLGDHSEVTSMIDSLISGGRYPGKSDQFKIGTGYGLDLGLMYRPSFAWKYGLLLSDVYTRISWWDRSEPSKIPMNLRLGAAFMPGWNLVEIFSDPIIALDMEDIFHEQKKNFFRKFHFGTEVKFLFRILSLRFGMNDGYPSVGAGIDISFYFLSKIPILKWLRPDKVYFPKFNPKDSDFAEKNPLCCCLTGFLAPITYAHIKFDITYAGYEIGEGLYDQSDYQLIARVALSYSY